MLLSVILLSGCLKENLDKCKERDNTLLLFRYKDKDGSDNFSEKIKRVDVLVFNSENKFVRAESVEKTDLDKFHGTSMALEPGEYRIVCWANIGDNTRMSDLHSEAMFETSYVETISPACGCPLYYAPYKEVVTRGVAQLTDYSIYTLVVPERNTVEKELDFIRAHRSVNVYVKGYEHIDDGDNTSPVVEGANLPARYNFRLEVDPERRNFKRVTEDFTAPEGVVQHAQFLTHYYDVEDDIFINVLKSSDESQVTSVNLKQYIDEKQISDLDDIDMLITIEEGGADITISLPPWNSSVVQPGL